jgi:hypothetical protein
LVQRHIARSSFEVTIVVAVKHQVNVVCLPIAPLIAADQAILHKSIDYQSQC